MKLKKILMIKDKTNYFKILALKFYKFKKILYSNTIIFYSNTKNLFLIEKYKSVDFIMFFKILIIFITLTQSLKTKKNIIVLEN